MWTCPRWCSRHADTNRCGFWRVPITGGVKRCRKRIANGARYDAESAMWLAEEAESAGKTSTQSSLGSGGAQRAATRDRRPAAGHMDRGKADRKRPMNGWAFAIGPFATHAARSAGHAWQRPLRVPLLPGDPGDLLYPPPSAPSAVLTSGRPRSLRCPAPHRWIESPHAAAAAAFAPEAGHADAEAPDIGTATANARYRA